MTPAPIVVSRSAIVTRKLCEAKRYYNYHLPHPDVPPTAQVGGIVPTQDRDASHLAKTRGIWLHGCMEQLLKGHDWQAWLTTETNAARMASTLQHGDTTRVDEQITLVRRAVIGWVKQRGHLLDLYTPISAEEEWTWSMDPLVAQTLRLDQIWRHKETDQILIVDFKTLGRPDLNWVDRLRNADQTHLYIQALEDRTGERIEGIQYEGIVIGKFDATLGMQKSTFTGGYGQAASLRTTLSPKWKARATWESNTAWTDDEWLQWADATGVLMENYITTGALHPPKAQLEQTKAATVRAEIEWADKMARIEENPALLPMLVERTADACLKFGAGYACPYVDLCWNGAQPDLESFDARIDHHAVKEEE